jgi:hypothetical protein
MTPVVPAGVAGGLLIAVGTHEPAVEVLLLRPGAGPAAAPTLAAVGHLRLAPPQRPPLRCGAIRCMLAAPGAGSGEVRAALGCLLNRGAMRSLCEDTVRSQIVWASQGCLRNCNALSLRSAVASVTDGASCWRRRWAWKPRRAEAAARSRTAGFQRACCCCRLRLRAAPQRCCAGLQHWA